MMWDILSQQVVRRYFLGANSNACAVIVCFNSVGHGHCGDNTAGNYILFYSYQSYEKANKLQR